MSTAFLTVKGKLLWKGISCLIDIDHVVYNKALGDSLRRCALAFFFLQMLLPLLDVIVNSPSSSLSPPVTCYAEPY
jgi:hypothetical protein